MRCNVGFHPCDCHQVVLMQAEGIVQPFIRSPCRPLLTGSSPLPRLGSRPVGGPTSARGPLGKAGRTSDVPHHSNDLGADAAEQLGHLTSQRANDAGDERWRRAQPNRCLSVSAASTSIRARTEYRASESLSRSTIRYQTRSSARRQSTDTSTKPSSSHAHKRLRRLPRTAYVC